MIFSCRALAWRPSARAGEIPTRPDVTAPYLKPYKLLPFEPQAIDDFDKYVALFRDTFKPGN